MIGFYAKHPEFKTVPFYLTGESYAGKYIPIMAKTILEYNAKQTGPSDFKIPLKGLIIGDPLTSPPI
jgi:carboxypeptidase C (cathepsin A)